MTRSPCAKFGHGRVISLPRLRWPFLVSRFMCALLSVPNHLFNDRARNTGLECEASSRALAMLGVLLSGWSEDHLGAPHATAVSSVAVGSAPGREPSGDHSGPRKHHPDWRFSVTCLTTLLLKTQ
jgi:hypothetical protein